ncbi:LOW QUALITY PROTEIN: hypothetical protein BRADI_2g16495v3 [Brachypodium distachyon]|uniref:Uncharacterized protein n=1 Tax=Brachypodium distachyon TaxID=15368 RepID=A0A2K2D8V4_BRADI|nr:LOW QUALITY PROTEIN: hypothetical protein BRADI_2g16495v3 [Brachypodium distachyon]
MLLQQPDPYFHQATTNSVPNHCRLADEQQVRSVESLPNETEPEWAQFPGAISADLQLLPPFGRGLPFFDLKVAEHKDVKNGNCNGHQAKAESGCANSVAAGWDHRQYRGGHKTDTKSGERTRWPLAGIIVEYRGGHKTDTKSGKGRPPSFEDYLLRVADRVHAIGGVECGGRPCGDCTFVTFMLVVDAITFFLNVGGRAMVMLKHLAGRNQPLKKSC